MTESPTEDLQDTEIKKQPAEETEPEILEPGHDEKPQSISGKFREASYVVLFIAAVFVINAMETGSYRTPWPVALVTLLAGLGLFGYSWYLQSRPKI
jgi:hypothetical protein